METRKNLSLSSFSVVIYNILADAYVRPERYPNSPGPAIGDRCVQHDFYNRARECPSSDLARATSRL
ncbi:MAG: hypothetical protein MJE77_01015 [Proteobacteria bacterium]|nr:hypothetical protein [Pseudomonadota bacterium]